MFNEDGTFTNGENEFLTKQTKSFCSCMVGGSLSRAKEERNSVRQSIKIFNTITTGTSYVSLRYRVFIISKLPLIRYTCKRYIVLCSLTRRNKSINRQRIGPKGEGRIITTAYNLTLLSNLSCCLQALIKHRYLFFVALANTGAKPLRVRD